MVESKKTPTSNQHLSPNMRAKGAGGLIPSPNGSSSSSNRGKVAVDSHDHLNVENDPEISS